MKNSGLVRQILGPKKHERPNVSASVPEVPLISIVTVSLNAVATIRDTLESVATQHAPFGVEHVCVDGGSSDGTRELIDEYAAKSRHLTRIYQPDCGLFDAMNKGLHVARGEYVLFLNADDFLIGHESLAKAFKDLRTGRSSFPDMVMGDVIMGHLDRLGLWRYRRVPRWLPSWPRLGAHPPHQGNFIRRELLIRSGGLDTTLRIAADTVQFYKLAHQYRPILHVTRTVVSFMRMGGVSTNQLGSYRNGNIETLRCLRQYMSPAACFAVFSIKVLQKLFEYRIGWLKRERLLTP